MSVRMRMYVCVNVYMLAFDLIELQQCDLEIGRRVSTINNYQHQHSESPIEIHMTACLHWLSMLCDRLLSGRIGPTNLKM